VRHVLAACLLLGAASAAAQERTLRVVVPAPQGKFPPPWTHTIRISVEDAAATDHRHWKPGSDAFRATLKGDFHNDVYPVEVLCLSKGEKKISVFSSKIRIRANTGKLVLDRLKFVELVTLP
jgi:hypothetical protein